MKEQEVLLKYLRDYGFVVHVTATDDGSFSGEMYEEENDEVVYKAFGGYALECIICLMELYSKNHRNDLMNTIIEQAYMDTMDEDTPLEPYFYMNRSMKIKKRMEKELQGIEKSISNNMHEYYTRLSREEEQDGDEL